LKVASSTLAVPGAECVAGSVALLLPSPLCALGVGLAALVLAPGLLHGFGSLGAEGGQEPWVLLA
jgi:hypothetical protein